MARAPCLGLAHGLPLDTPYGRKVGAGVGIQCSFRGPCRKAEVPLDAKQPTGAKSRGAMTGIRW